MEEEKFLTGYCRVLDSSRMVELILLDGKLSEADCNYGSCPYQSTCPIAKEIEEYQ